MASSDSPWEEKILNSMKTGAVTFAWDDDEVRTVATPDRTLDTLQSAWEWIDARIKEMEKEKGRPRSVCFRLTSGEFRGLRFPDWNPGAI